MAHPRRTGLRRYTSVPVSTQLSCGYFVTTVTLWVTTIPRILRVRRVSPCSLLGGFGECDIAGVPASVGVNAEIIPKEVKPPVYAPDVGFLVIQLQTSFRKEVFHCWCNNVLLDTLSSGGYDKIVPIANNIHFRGPLDSATFNAFVDAETCSRLFNVPFSPSKAIFAIVGEIGPPWGTPALDSKLSFFLISRAPAFSQLLRTALSMGMLARSQSWLMLSKNPLISASKIHFGR